MSSKSTQRWAIGTIAIAAMVCGGVAVKKTVVRFGAQDARSPQVSFATKLDELGVGQDGRSGTSSLVVTLPDGSSGVKSFAGEIGSRDEAIFTATDGSGDSVYVSSLDERLGTLIVIRAMGPTEVSHSQVSMFLEDRLIGDAYAFGRQDGGTNAFALKWSARGMDSARAIDVDTHLELHGGTVAQALTELRTEQLGVVSPGLDRRGSARPKRPLFVRR